MIDIPQEIPPQIRDLAEKNVEQAREAFLGFMGAAQKATGATEVLPSAAKDTMTKAVSFAEENVKAAFDLAQKLVRAKDVQEIFALQTEFATSRLTALCRRLSPREPKSKDSYFLAPVEQRIRIIGRERVQYPFCSPHINPRSPTRHRST